MPALARLALSALAASTAASGAGRSTWQEEAQITNPYAECAPYGYAPVDGEFDKGGKAGEAGCARRQLFRGPARRGA